MEKEVKLLNHIYQIKDLMQLYRKEEVLVSLNTSCLYHKFCSIWRKKREYKTVKQLITYSKYTAKEFTLPLKYFLMIK